MRSAAILVLAAFTVPAWPQAMVEYGLSVGRAGVTGVNTKGAFDKAGAALGKAAGKPQAAGTAPTARQQEVARNREALAAFAGEDAATVELTTPDGTVISMDQRVVGYGKASLKLAAGKHKVRVAGPGYVAWEEELELAAKESRTLTPQMERAKSTANVIQIGGRAQERRPTAPDPE